MHTKAEQPQGVDSMLWVTASRYPFKFSNFRPLKTFHHCQICLTVIESYSCLTKLVSYK